MKPLKNVHMWNSGVEFIEMDVFCRSDTIDVDGVNMCVAFTHISGALQNIYNL